LLRLKDVGLLPLVQLVAGADVSRYEAFGFIWVEGSLPVTVLRVQQLVPKQAGVLVQELPGEVLNLPLVLFILNTLLL